MGEKQYQDVLEGSNLTYINAKKLLEAGRINEVVAEGIFMGPIDNQFGGTDYKLTLLDGSDAILNGCGHLKRQMDVIENGTGIRVTYLGQEVIAKGSFKGKAAHQFRVEAEVEA